MDKETGEAVTDADGNAITATKTFTAETEDGTVDVEFTFDGTGLAGTTVVAFESVEYKGVEVAVHADITDENQTVYFPEIGTTATDKSDGDHKVSPTDSVTITDKVEYEGLTPDTEYKMVGTLMDKETGKAVLIDGKEVTAEKVFTPTESSGSVDVEFTFSAKSLAGKTLVVFEKCYTKDADGYYVETANHEDLTDSGQTVTVSAKVKTGDSSFGVAAGIIGACAAAGAVALVARNRRKRT